MQGIASPPLDRRLQQRFFKMVQAHLHAAPQLAAGMASLPSTASAFAATQAAWRFLNNPRVTLPALVAPLRALGRERAAATQASFLLLVHDWCKLRYDHSGRKNDLVHLTHAGDVGYELTTALLVSADDGSPLAPLEMHLLTAQGVLSTRDRAPRAVAHLEQVLPTMRASATWGLTKPLVHVLDREADSVDHYRRWHGAGQYFLVRADDRRVRWGDESWLLSGIGRRLRRRQAFQAAGKAVHQGRSAQLWVAETDVVLYRPAKKNVRDLRFQRPGKPLKLRFLVVQLRDDRGRVLAEWKLLSNVPLAWATTTQLAFCYYWRWRIESFFKLLKRHGQQLEQWLQESGAAVARRLLIAALACVLVWQLQADGTPQAMELKNVLVRLSGRQTKRRRPHTAPALLAGLWVLLSMLALMEHIDLQDLRRLVASVPYLNSG
jgi:hypothetical protein